MDNGLACLDLLASTPAILRGLMAGLAEADAVWKPAPDRFSVAEVLAHLTLSETHCYRARVDLMLEQDRPRLAADDASLHYAEYAGRDPEEDFAHFEEQRETNVEFLRRLPRGAGTRIGVHETLGEFTLNQMLHEWAIHDLGHIRQVAELVRARLLAGAGPWASTTPVSP